MPKKPLIRLALIAELPGALALCAGLAAGCAANGPLPPLETRPVVPSPLILQQLTQPKCWLKPSAGCSNGTLEYGVVAENKTHEYLDAEAHFAAYAPDGTRLDYEPFIFSREVFGLAPHEKAYFTASGSSVPLATNISAINVVCRFTLSVTSMPPRLRRSVQIYDVSLVPAGGGIGERRFVGTARIATRWPQVDIPRVIFRYYDEDGIRLAESEHTNVLVQREVPLRVVDSQLFDVALPLPQRLTVSAYAQ